MTTDRDDSTELSAAIDELSAKFCSKSAEERAFILLRNYFETTAETGNDRENDRENSRENDRENDRDRDDFDYRFWVWFSDPRNRREKDAAMLRVIEMLDRRTNDEE